MDPSANLFWKVTYGVGSMLCWVNECCLAWELVEGKASRRLLSRSFRCRMRVHAKVDDATMVVPRLRLASTAKDNSASQRHSSALAVVGKVVSSLSPHQLLYSKDHREQKHHTSADSHTLLQPQFVRCRFRL